MENKTGKYLKYAIGEIVLVVIGILIALQINNWNENRKSKIEERIILESVKKEFKINKADLIETAEKVKLQEARVKNVLRYTGQPNTQLTKEQSDSLIRPLMVFISADVSTYNVDELISSGKMHLIQNDSLKFLLTNWKKELQDRLIESENNVFNLVVNQLHPFLTEQYSFDFYKLNERKNSYYGFEFQSKFEDNYRKVYQDRVLENYTLLLLMHLRLVLNDNDALVEISDQVIKFIDEELKIDK